MSHAPATPGHAHGHHHAHGEGHHHVTSVRLLLGILITLLVLTVLTVYTAREIHVGLIGNLIIAMSIASLKAALVCAFFMHLLHDKPINSVILFFCMLAFVTFLLITMIDLGNRGNLDPLRAPSLAEPPMVADAWAAAEAEHGNPDAAHADEGHAEETPANEPEPAPH